MNKEIEYKVDHLDLFDSEELKNEEEIERLKLFSNINDEAITILIDGIPVISTGLRILSDSTGEVWMIKSKCIEKHAVYIVKRLGELINFYAEKYNLLRIQTLIKPEHEKWIKTLGFEKESELVNFDKDSKFYLYRRLFKWE